MNFEVFSVSGADPSYGAYNVGPTTSQFYTGEEFTDYGEDGTSHCAQAQAMPAVVPMKMKWKDLRNRDNTTLLTTKGIHAGTVLKMGDSAFVVTSYVEKPANKKTAYIPIAVSGATMVDREDLKNGTDRITAGDSLVTKNGDIHVGIAMIDEEPNTGFVMAYIC